MEIYDKLKLNSEQFTNLSKMWQSAVAGNGGSNGGSNGASGGNDPSAIQQHIKDMYDHRRNDVARLSITYDSIHSQLTELKTAMDNFIDKWVNAQQ